MTTPPSTKRQMGMFLRSFVEEHCIGKESAPKEGFCRMFVKNGPERLFFYYDFENKRFWFVFTTPYAERRLFTTKTDPYAVLDHLYDDAGLDTGVDLDTNERLPRVLAEGNDDDGDDEEWDDVPIPLGQMIKAERSGF